MAGESKHSLRIVCCSDTHGKHREVEVPEGDIFIHAGDFTHFGKLDDAIDFNDWLGDENIFGGFKVKIVVNGNHESNAPWKKDVRSILSNAVFLRNEAFELDIGDEIEQEDDFGASLVDDKDSNTKNSSDTENQNTLDDSSKDPNEPPNFVTDTAQSTQKKDKVLKIYGSEFYWPMESKNPYYGLIPSDTDILVVHGPAKGYVDGGVGCPALLNRVNSLVGNENSGSWNMLDMKSVVNTMKNWISPSTDQEMFSPDRLLLVVSGHIHKAHGVSDMAVKSRNSRVTFVNAAIANQGYQKGWDPVQIDFQL